MIKFLSRQGFEQLRSMQQIQALSWKAFEHFSRFLLERLQYTNVRVSEKHGDHGADGGIDLYARQNGHSVVGQCKHRIPDKEGRIQVPVIDIRALGGCMRIAKADQGVFIATIPFSKPAIRDAALLDIRLIGPEDIKAIMTEVNPDFEQLSYAADAVITLVALGVVLALTVLGVLLFA